MYRRYSAYTFYRKRRRQRGAMAVRFLIVVAIMIVGGFSLAYKFERNSPVAEVVVAGQVIEKKDSEKIILAPAVDQEITLTKNSAENKLNLKATRKVSSDNSAYLVIGELPALAAQQYYEVWAVREKPFAVLSVGKMTRRTDGKFSSTYESREDLREYHSLMITLQKAGKDKLPGEHIIEGIFP